MKKIILVLFLFGSLSAVVQQTILINNAQIFNGIDEKIIIGNVFIEDNLIKQISQSPIVIPMGGNVEVIDAKGKFLMTGLIDAHVHMTMDAMPL